MSTTTKTDLLAALAREKCASWLETKLIHCWVSPDGTMAHVQYAVPSCYESGNWFVYNSDSRFGTLPQSPAVGYFDRTVTDLSAASHLKPKGKEKWILASPSALAEYRLAIRGTSSNLLAFPSSSSASGFLVWGGHWYGGYGKGWKTESTALVAATEARKEAPLLGASELLVGELPRYHLLAREALAWICATRHWAGLDKPDDAKAGMDKGASAAVTIKAGWENASSSPWTERGEAVGFVPPKPPVLKPVYEPITKVIKPTSNCYTLAVLEGVVHAVEQIKFSVDAPTGHPIWVILPLLQSTSRLMPLRTLLSDLVTSSAEYEVSRLGPVFSGEDDGTSIAYLAQRRQDFLLDQSQTMPPTVVGDHAVVTLDTDRAIIGENMDLLVAGARIHMLNADWYIDTPQKHDKHRFTMTLHKTMPKLTAQPQYLPPQQLLELHVPSFASKQRRFDLEDE